MLVLEEKTFSKFIPSSVASRDRVQVLAVNQLHHQKDDVVGFTRVMGDDDIRMLQLR